MPYTYEGCVVKISDKIAYLGRDLQDATLYNFFDRRDYLTLRQLAENVLKEKVSLNDLKRVLLTVKECPEAENYAAAVELAEKAMINIFIAREKDFSANTRKSLVFILNFINNEQCTSSLNRQKLAEYCLKKIDEIDNFLKTILTSIANAKNEIDYALRRRNYKYLKSVLNKHKWFYDLSKNKAVLDKLIEIYNKNPNTVAKLYKERGLCGEYDLLSPCSSCNERGLANCKICDNTGKCPTCNGYGYKTFTASRWNGHDFEKYERRTPCYPRCSHCRGQTSKCYTCTGLGICIDEKKLQKAIESEIISLKRELIAIENNYTHK